MNALAACGAGHSSAPRSAAVATPNAQAIGVLPIAADAAQGPAPLLVASGARGHVVDAGCGWQHACALLDDGTVRCWGRGDSGQIGDGMGEDRRRPALVIADEGVTRGTAAQRAPLTGVVGLGVGNVHACALLKSGSVRCWGASSSGQLAAGSGGGWSPRTVSNVVDAVEIASGQYFNCARIKDGTVRCWGAVPLGTRKNPPQRMASPVETIGGLSNAVKLAIGDGNACAVLADGGVACWPATGFGEGSPKVATREPAITDAVDAWAAKDRGGCARRRSGDIACWGSMKPPEVRLAHAAWGDREHCVVDESGQATCTGRNPVRLAGVRKTATGGTVSCAILTTGELRCWGSTEYGQLGEGSGRVRSTPVRVIELARSDALWVGTGSCAREGGGAIKCWGSNSDDVLGFEPPPYYAAVPVALSGLRGATQVSIADGTGCALRADGSVVCWDKDTKGVPTLVPGVADVRELAVAQEHVCARHGDGTASCWGAMLGSLGRGGVVRDGDTGPYPPARVKGLTDVAQIAAGTSATCARLGSGKVRCWGSTGYLGDGSHPSRRYVTTATWVKGIADATFLSVGTTGTEACVIKKDRTLACWGHEIYGEFGDWEKEEEYVDHATPISSRGVENVIGLAVGDGSTCVLTLGGAVQCFGGNQWGEIGDGTTEVRARPQAVPGLTDVVEIGAHGNVMCARKRDGSVWCWGRSDFGGVGDGAPNERTEPFPVALD